ncbi:putative leucine-rich repeat-containing protein DDB_G0290503 isoform X2 [Chironomus tepperi]
MWNDVFLHKDEATGNEIAIIVVDTHGLFDNVTSSMDNSRIFTLDILISSIQVFNLSGVIQDDHLQFLQSAIECAKFASKTDIKKEEKYFQNLVFLIRDWNSSEEFCYGIDGGRSYWNNFIENSGNQKVELAYICESILDSYDDVSCALLPHPGKSVKPGSRGYNGSWKKFDEDFKEELVKVIDHLLKPENLVVKKVNGSAVNGDEFYEYVNGQLKVIEKDEVLDRKIEEIFKDLIQQQIQKEKEAAEEQLEKIRQESKHALELENQKKEKELAELIEKSKQECAEIEKRKNIERQAVDDEIRAIHDKLKEARMQVEQRLREQNNSEQSNQDQNSVLTDADNVMKENEEPASNIISNPTIPQNADIKLESENDNSKEIDSQMQTIVAEDNVINIEKSKSDTPRSDNIPDFDCSARGQESIEQDNQTSSESPNPPEKHNKDQSKSNPRLEESKFLASEPTHTMIDIEQITSEFVKLQEKIDKVNDEMSRDNWNVEVNFDHDYCQPGASTSTDHKDDSDSSWETVEFPDTSLNSNRKHRQDYYFDDSAINKDQRRMEEGWKLALEVPSIIKLITYSEQNESVINTDQLTKIFGNDTVKNRKIVAVLITGDDSEDKIKTLNICLDYLYGKYPSLYQKNQNRRKYVQSSIPTSSASLEMWNDVFLYTTKDNDDIAIVLMNIQGLLGNNFYNCLKIYLISTLISSIQVINVPDILTRGFTCCQRLALAWNSLESWSILNLLRKIWNARFLPHINGTVYAYFNKTPEQKILPHLHSENLIIKTINGLKVTGTILIKMIVNYHEKFQQSSMSNAQDVAGMISSIQIDVFIERSIGCYNEYMIKKQNLFTTKECTEDLHKIAVQNAKIMLEDLIRDVKELKSEKYVIFAKLESKLDHEFKKHQENTSK